MGKRIAVGVITASVIHIILMLRFEGYAEMWDALFRALLEMGVS